MSVVVRAVYHKNGIDSTTTAYIIGIYIKNWARKHVVYMFILNQWSILYGILAQQQRE